MIEKKRMFQALLISVALFVLTFPLLLRPADEKEKTEKDELFRMSLEELMKVKITTAGKTEEIVCEIPASVVVLTREEIERYGYTTVAEILGNVPGIYAIENRDWMGTVFGVRGYWTGQPRNFIVLVNDVEQSDSLGVYHLQNFNLPVEAIDRIEVVRGPMSVMYGSGAFFGAINIFTNKPSDDVSYLMSASIGSEKTKRVAIRYAYKDDDLKLVFNAGYYDTYGPDEPLDKMVSDMSSLASYNISGAANNTTTGGRLESNNVYFSLSAKYKGFFADVSLNRSAREEYHFWPSFSDGLLHKKKFTTVAFGYKKALSDKLAVKGTFKYYLSSYWREFDYFIDDFFGQELNHSEKYELELNAVYKPTEDINILFGLNFKDNDVVEKLDIRTVFQLSTGDNTNNIKNFAFFAQTNCFLLENLQLVVGIRLEKLPEYTILFQDNEASFIIDSSYKIEKMEVVPRFAVLFSLNDSNVLKLLFGRAVKFPTPQDVLQQKYHNYNGLESEYISTLELNYLATLSSAFSLNFSVFRNSLDNLIVTVLQFNDQGNWAPRPSNSGKTVTHGAELMVYAKPFENLLFELSGTFQETKDKRVGFENRDIEYSPNFLGYVKAAYSLTPDITLAFTGKYVGGMETLWDTGKPDPGGTITTGGRIGHHVAGYFTLAANLRFSDLFGKGYYLNLRCTNLFDTDYLYPIFTSNSGWADKGTFGNGRTFLVSIGKRF
ncbi:MAG: TonB-dependent receptor plug domain-containing protein [bacterium]|nr:TonB-dependent receptor plug domain-containing protein [bacterium]